MTYANAPLVLYIAGPTASGKTALALELAEKGLAGREVCLISVDSALIYRGMDIGTAKPEPELLAQYPHALIDIREPYETYSVAEFVTDCRQAIEIALSEGKIPLCVGGTMMYYKALTLGLAELPQASESLRQAISEEAAVKGWQAMHDSLKAFDPVAANRIHPNDPQRLQRAIEVYRASNVPLTQWLQQGNESGLLSDFNVKVYALSPMERSVLHDRIAQRFQHMLDCGFIEEVEQLRALPNIHQNLPSMRSVGYRQVWSYLDGDFDKNRLFEKGVVATRQLAKRQLTWLRNWPVETKWLDPDSENLPSLLISDLESSL